MVATCCVNGCSNSIKNTKNISFFRFPKVNLRFKPEVQELLKKRRRNWFTSIKRQDLIKKEVSNLRICGKHFISGKPASLLDVDNPDWSPSLEMDCDPESDSSLASRMKRFQRTYREALQEIKVELETPNYLPIFHDIGIDTEVTQNSDETGVSTQTDLTCSFLSILECESIDRNRQLYELREQVKRLTFADESCLADQSKCRFYTGLPSVEVVKFLLSKIDEALLSVKVGNLNNFQKLLLTLMKLRSNITFRGLAYRFDSTIQYVSTCFQKVIILLAYAFRHVVVRIHVEKDMKNLKNKFKILSGPVSLNLRKCQYENKTIMEYVGRVCCILNNLSESVVPLDDPEKCDENMTVL